VNVISTRNLFIVNTPLQLTTAYIIAYTYCKTDDNVLVIAQPKQYPRWHAEPLIKCLLNQKVWKSLHSITGQEIKKKSFLDVKNFIAELKAKIQTNGRVFLGNDKQIINQLLVELSGNKTYSRFDEGIGSYTPGIVNRKLRSKMGEYALIKLMQFLFDCNQGLQYNFGGMGCGKAAIADYLYKPELLSRYSPRVVEITRDQIQSALLPATNGLPQQEQKAGNECLLYLGGSYAVLKNDISVILDNELWLLRQLDEWAQATGRTILYKPHPGEPKEKIERYKNAIRNIVFYDSIEPIELICNTNTTIRYMISLFSSGMLYLDKFAAAPIKTITIANLLESRIGKPLVTERQKEIMNICHIAFPKDITELTKLIIDEEQ